MYGFCGDNKDGLLVVTKILIIMQKTASHPVPGFGIVLFSTKALIHGHACNSEECVPLYSTASSEKM